MGAMDEMFADLPERSNEPNEFDGMFDDLPTLTAADPVKRKVGFGEAAGRGASRSLGSTGKVLGSLLAAPLIPIDFISSKLGLTEPGAITDPAAGLLVDPSQRNIEHGTIDPRTEELGPGGTLGYAGGSLAGMIPDIVAGRPAATAAREVGAVASAMTNAMRAEQGVVPGAITRATQTAVPEAIGAIPAAAVQAEQRYADLTGAGVDPLTAGLAGAITVPSTVGSFAAPISAAGGPAARAVTGAGANVAIGAGTRAAESFLLPDEIAQPILPADQVATEAGLGALLALLLGRRAPGSLEEQGLVQRMKVDQQRAGEAADAAAAQQFQADLAQYGPILEANGVAADDPRTPNIIAILKERDAKAAEEAAATQAAMSPDEQRIRAAEQPPDTIIVDPQGRATAELPPGEIDATKAGMLSAEGTAAKTEVQARQAFDVAEAQAKRKQDALDAGTMAGEPRDLRDASAGGTTGPEPLSPRMQQDAAAQSYAPPRGVGTGENQPDPRRAAQRITTRPGAEYLPAEEPPNQTPARAPQTYDSTAERQGGELAPPRPPEEPPALAGPQARPALPAPPAAEQPIKTPEPPRLAAPPKPARRVTAEQLDGKPLSYEHTVGGKKTKVSHKDAGAALRQADSRVDSIRRLIDCLGA